MNPIHPSVEQLLAGGPGAAEHAGTCLTCRTVMALATPVATAADTDRDLDALPVIDRGLYVGWRELVDGAGGMGRTYRVRDRRLAREVAIKQVGDGGGDPALAAALRRRFELEARLTARLAHPAIVAIHEAGRFANGEPFYAMPLVRGVSLDVEIERRPTLAQRLGLLPHLTTACEAIAYAHGEGIVHRDLKPKNIMIGPFGETIVIDWGLARDLSATGPDAEAAPFRDLPADGLTRAGLGTPQYMAPEQAGGHAATEAMDIYALGATLYHLLAGEPSYGRATAGARAAVRAGPPRELAELVPTARRELIDIVTRAMARTPADRFPTVRELADELRRFQTGQLLHSRRYTVREVLAHFVRRHRLAVAITAVAMVTVAVIGALAIERVARARTRAVAGERGAVLELRRARGITASQLAPHAPRRLEALELALAAVAPVAGEQVPTEAVVGLTDALAQGPALVVLRGHVGSGLTHAFTADGQRLATLGDDGRVRVWSTRTGAPLAEHVVATARPYEVLFVGAELLITGFGPAIERWDPTTDHSRLLTGADSMQWAVAGTTELVTGSTTGALIAWQGVRPVARVELGSGITVLEGEPDGAVAAGLSDGTVAVWPAARGPVRWLRGHHGHVTGVGFDADSHVLSAASDGVALRWTDERAPTRVFTAVPGMPIYGLRVSPDRRRLAVVAGGVAVVTLDADGALGPVVAIALGQPSYRHSFTAAGRLATTTGYQATLWDLDGAPLFTVPAGGVAQLPEVVVSPDGERMVTSDEQGQTWLWDTRLGVATGMLPGHASEVTAVAIAPAGDRVVTAGLDGRVAIVELATGRVVAARTTGVELVGVRWLAGGAALVWWDTDGIVELSDREGHTRARWPGGAADVAVEDDGAVAWLATDDGRVIALSDGGAREVATGAGSLTRVAVAGDLIATGGADGAVTVQVGGRLSILRPGGDGRAVETLAFTPDRVHLVAGWLGGPTRIYRFADSALALELEGAPLAWSADGRTVATTISGGGLALHDLVGGRSIIVDHPGAVLAAAFSPDGATVATAGLDGAIRSWDAVTGEPHLRYAAELGGATALAFTPDGASVIAGYARGAVRAWPTSLTGARARACAALAELGRAAATAAWCQ